MIVPEYHCIDSALSQWRSDTPPKRLVVGFSGGLDSTVLLHLVRVWRQQQTDPACANIEVLALHVNHQLQAQASQWQQHCAAICQQWGMAFVAQQAEVDQHQASLEQAARKARYGAFSAVCKPGDALLLAHHRDDQVETLLQRLARGSGPLGLAAMSTVSNVGALQTIRPLLSYDREQLQHYAEQHQLTWIEDPTNQHDQHERNFLRNRVLPRWRERKPQLNQTLERVTRLCEESAALLEDLAQLDRGQPRADGGLPCSALAALPQRRQRNLVRSWVREAGYALPSEAVLNRVLDEVLPAPADAQPQVEWGGVSLHRYQHVLYLVPAWLARCSTQPIGLGSLSIPQCLPYQLALPHGELQILDSNQAPLQLPLEPSSQQPPSQSIAALLSQVNLTAASLSVGFRQGKEQAQPVGRPRKKLKDWFQEYRVPPWLRSHWPILFCDQRIAAVPGLFVCEGFQPKPGEASVNLSWQWRLSSIESTG